MAIHIKANKGVHPDNHEEFVCDYLSDIANLPTVGCVPSSEAFVIEDSSNWMLNNAGVWNKIIKQTSGGGGGGTIDESNVATDKEVEDMLNEVFSK